VFSELLLELRKYVASEQRVFDVVVDRRVNATLPAAMYPVDLASVTNASVGWSMDVLWARLGVVYLPCAAAAAETASRNCAWETKQLHPSPGVHTRRQFCSCLKLFLGGYFDLMKFLLGRRFMNHTLNAAKKISQILRNKLYHGYIQVTLQNVELFLLRTCVKE
jgi:hypothetical protein